jgi:peroxiredoxin
MKKLVWLVGFALIVTGCRKSEQKFEVANSQPKYPVSQETLQETSKSEKAAVRDTKLIFADSQTLQLSQLAKKGPIVCISIKEGCPCSMRAQPLFNNLHEIHNGKASFIGLIDSNANTTMEYIQDTKANFPIVTDPKKELINQLAFKRATYIVLINQKMQIEKAWPGYSQSVLKELNAELCRLTHQKPKSFDTQYAPKRLVSGCSFE